MSAFALRATVLIYLDARAGDWVPLDDICKRVGCTAERVAPVCAHLVADGMAHHARGDLRDYYGTQVEGHMLAAQL